MENDETMFDEIVRTEIKPDGMVEASLVDDTAQEMKDAVVDMQRSWKEFRELSDSPIAAHNYNWWKALMYLSFAEDRLKEAFLGRDRSPASVKQFHRWRLRIIFGWPSLRADA
jgi:hypothetical protein